MTHCETAILNGLNLIHSTASDPDNFEAYGFDYLFSFSQISSTSQNSNVRALAARMGKECAVRWQLHYPNMLAELAADTVTQLVFGSLSANRLGVCDGLDPSRIRSAAGQFSSAEYFWFDPAREPPPVDIPAECDFGWSNSHSAKGCEVCAQADDEMMSRYEVWLVALIRSYLGEQYGVTLGARFYDVIKWLPVMRPYPYPNENSLDFQWSIYAATHVCYTLNDYNRYRLNPAWLPDEYDLLNSSIELAISDDDPETVGEILDCLKSFGVPESDRKLKIGVEYLLATQNPDGSWGNPDSDDVYERYHPTLAAVSGLDEYGGRLELLTFPELQPLLKQWAKQNSAFA